MNAKTERKKAPEAETKAPEAETRAPVHGKNAAKKVAGLRVTTKRDGFRRGGRAWHGTTEIACSDLTAEQLAQVKAEPLFTVIEIEIER